MRGVFGAGVATRLQEANIYDQIEAVYAYSSGAFNGAYFLARQSRIGSTIYFDHLTENFIRKRNVFKGVWQRAWNRYVRHIPPESFKNVVELPFLMDIAKNRVPLDVRALQSQSIPLFVKVLDAKTGEVDYFDARTTDTLKLLHAAASAAPYYFSSEEINGKLYIDAGIKESIALAKLLEDHKQNNIVVVFNRPVYSRLGGIVKYFETKILGMMYGKHIAKLYDERDKKEDADFQLAETSDRVLLVHPSKNDAVYPGETRRNKLLALYRAGQIEAEKILNFIL